jgi:replicative DNA helicase
MQNKSIHTSIVPAGYDFGKIPPQAQDIESAVLGALILHGDSIYDIADILTADAFYRDEHQKICQAIINLFESNRKVDMLTVSEELRKQKQLDEVGGPVYIAQLTNSVSSSSHILTHYRIVFQKFIQREIIRDAAEKSTWAFDESIELDELIEKMNKGVDDINEKIAGKKQSSHISTILNKSMESLRERELAAKENKIVGIRTPVIDLDKKLQGWKPNVIVIAAASGEGKTSAALAIAKKAAEYGCPVCIFSLEMQNITLADRLILAEADINEYNFRSGYVSREDNVAIEKAKAKLSKLPIYSDDNPITNFTYIKVHSRIMKKKGLCGLVIIDYLQLCETEKDASREREVAKFMRNLVILKKELNVPIIVLSQLNRMYEDKRSKRPTLAMLRESGSISQDADIVIFVYRPEYHGILQDHDGNNTKGKGIFIVAKHRNGPTGDVPFSYNDSVTKIYDYVDPNRFQPMNANKDRQLPPERNDPDIVDIPDEERQGDLPF